MKNRIFSHLFFVGMACVLVISVSSVVVGQSGKKPYKAGAVSGPTTTTVQHVKPATITLGELIQQTAVKYGLDPILLVELIRKESSFQTCVKSKKGATGLMQLMPGTAARFGVTNICDPAQNLDGGAKYLRLLIDLFKGDLRLALAGYNAGEGAVIKYGYKIPPYSETIEYVSTILNRYIARVNNRNQPSYSSSQIAKSVTRQPEQNQQPLVKNTSQVIPRIPLGDGNSSRQNKSESSTQQVNKGRVATTSIYFWRSQ